MKRPKWEYRFLIALWVVAIATLLGPWVCYGEDLSLTINTEHENSQILKFEPTQNIKFYAPDDELVGKVDWSSGSLKFEGQIDETAKVFFEHFWKVYVEPCHDAGIKT